MKVTQSAYSFIHSFIIYITLIYLHVVAILSDVLDASSFVSEIKHCTHGIKHCILTCMNEWIWLL